MPEILVVSGKGGTGKTSVTAALAHLAGQAVICDLDVDAPDLHLLLAPKPWQENDFYSGNLAVVNPDLCTACGECVERCRYGAVSLAGEAARVAPSSCEGCGVCVHFCPAGAIDFPQRYCGRWFLSDTRYGPMAHAQLFPGQENSGRLVALLRAEARKLAEEKGHGIILSDGPPGIGCPVISSLSGASLAVAVTEPTLSGRHDLTRLAELCAHFKTPLAVIINKADINQGEAQELVEYCESRGYPLLARLPYDTAFTKAMIAGKAVTEMGDSEIADGLQQAWNKINQLAAVKKAA